MTGFIKWKFEYPYPIHDWKNESLYPKVQELSRKQWAWEFLRRNKDYQFDYDRLTNNQDFPEIEEIISDVPFSLEKQKSLEDEIKLYHLSIEYADSLFKSENLNSLVYRKVRLEDGNEITLRQALLRKYKLFSFGNTRFHNPREKLPANNFFDLQRKGLDTLHFNPQPKGKRFALAPESPEQIVFRLNARHSITDQKKHVENCLYELKNRLDLPNIRNKSSDQSLIKYIRALDSQASKATETFNIKDIVKKIGNTGETTNSPNKTYDEWLTPATNLSNNEYLSLLENTNI